MFGGSEDPKRAGNDHLKERPAGKMADKKTVHDVLHKLAIDQDQARRRRGSRSGRNRRCRTEVDRIQAQVDGRPQSVADDSHGARDPYRLGHQLAVLFEGATSLATSLNDTAALLHARSAAEVLIDSAVRQLAPSR
jgi:hypothetical protein